MPTEKKIQQVAELTDLVSRSTILIGAEYRGLSVKDLTALRRQLSESGVEMHVIKNTLFLRAAQAAGREGAAGLADGPTAIIAGFDDPIAPVKTIVEYQRTARNTFAARAAFLEGQIIAGSQLSDLASMPSKTEMIAMFAGALQSPIANLVGLLQATIQEFSGLIDARAEQLA